MEEKLEELYKYIKEQQKILFKLALIKDGYIPNNRLLPYDINKFITWKRTNK